MPEIIGIAHVELSVRDLEASVRWYSRLFEAEEVFRGANAEEHFKAVAIREPRSKIVLAFTQHDEVREAPFTPRRTGLDHLSFAVADRVALESWEARLRDIGIDHDGIADYGTHTALTFKDPDGIALEMVARAPRAA